MSDCFDFDDYDPSDWDDIELDNYGKWTTRKGDCLRICNMETSHILNCISFLRRKYSHSRSIDAERKLQEFKIEICFRDYCERNKDSIPVFVEPKRKLFNR